MKKFPEWQTPAVHPAAQKLPMMSDAELAELAADIKANGLLEPIIIWQDNREEANGATGPFETYLLDGRNRLAALERLDITDPRYAPKGPKTTDTVRVLRAIHEYSGFNLQKGLGNSGWKTEVDPLVYVLSANVRRRHLTAEQKRQAIAAYIAADPKANDREVARTLAVSPTTVGDVRSVQNVRAGQNEHLPIERAKNALRADQTLSVRQVSTDANVGVGTAHKARKELEEAGEIPPKESTRAQSPKAKTTKTKASPTQPTPNPTTEAGQVDVAPRNLTMRKLRNDLIAFSENQIGKLDEIENGDASPDDIAEYVVAVEQIAAKLKASANRLVNGKAKEVQSK